MSSSLLKPFRPQQVAAATEVEAIFADSSIRYVFLNADVQSGKTGAFHCVIRRMLEAEAVERAYILCGSAETTLQAQARADATEYNGDLVALGKISVIFRQDFAKHRMNTDRTLIVVDESHMDQDIKQQLAKFLGGHGLAMDGTRPTMIAQNTYILSVDATGYSELSAVANGRSRGKAVVHLKAGEGYFGPADYFAARGRLLHPTFGIHSDEGMPRFLNLFRPHTWNLMRLPGGRRDTKNSAVARIRRACEDAGIRVLLFNSAREDVIISCAHCEKYGPADCTLNKPCLSHRPDQPTLVILDGRLRAGKVVPKRHIGFVWEGARNSKTDAVIQGLFGRMCGYVFGAEMPQVFIPAALLKEHAGERFKWCEIERHLLAHGHRRGEGEGAEEIPAAEGSAAIAVPAKATNMKGATKIKLSADKYVCSPIRFQLGEDSEWLSAAATGMTTTDRERIVKSEALSILRANLDWVRDHPTMSEDQKTEILAGLEGATADNTHVRNIRAASAKSAKEYLTDLVRAHRTGTVPTSQHISDFPFLTFVAVAPDYSTTACESGDVFAVFYTTAKGASTAIPLQARFPTVQKKCAFVAHELCASADAVGNGAIGITKEQMTTPIIFKDAMRDYVGIQRDAAAAGFAGLSQLTFHTDRTFNKSQFAYKSPTDNALKVVLNALGDELGLRFKLKFVKGGTRASSAFFAVESISWK